MPNERLDHRHLILKDLYFLRWILVGIAPRGLRALAIMPLSRISTYVAGVSLICG